MTHLDFCDPAVKFFLDDPKILHWNIELDDLVVVGGWVFPGHSLKISSFYRNFFIYLLLLTLTDQTQALKLLKIWPNFS